MTLPYEEANSLKAMRKMLEDWRDWKGQVRKGEIRQRIRSVLRHYPWSYWVRRRFYWHKALAINAAREISESMLSDHVRWASYWLHFVGENWLNGFPTNEQIDAAYEGDKS